MTRHLLYFVHPIADAVWRANVAELLARIDLFDGVRAAAVTRGPAAAAVRAVLEPAGVAVVDVDNDPRLGEVVGFRPLWERVEGESGVAFYAHAKGVTHPPDHPAHPWTAMLYASNLDYWPLVETAFGKKKDVVGSFRQTAPRWSRFIYSGAFFWFRPAAVFRHRWWRHACPPTWAGVELWPGRAVPPPRAANLFKDYAAGMQAYDQTWMAHTCVEFRAWSDAHAAARRPGAVNDPWTPYLSRIRQGVVA